MLLETIERCRRPTILSGLIGRAQAIGVQSWPLILTLLFAFCKSEIRPDERYQDLAEDLYAGNIVSAYDKAVPPSYEADLNELLQGLQSLIGEQEFEQVRQLIVDQGARLQNHFDGESGSPSFMKILVAALWDLPSHLSLSSYEGFQQATIRGIIESFQTSSLSRAMRSPESPVEWSRQTVEMLESGPDKAVLTVRSVDRPNESKQIEVVLVEGFWVPREIADDWDGRVASLRDQIDSLRIDKERDPDSISRLIDQIGLRIEFLTEMAIEFLQQP